jgi:hypothetical protein
MKNEIIVKQNSKYLKKKKDRFRVGVRDGAFRVRFRRDRKREVCVHTHIKHSVHTHLEVYIHTLCLYSVPCTHIQLVYTHINTVYIYAHTAKVLHTHTHN